MATSLVHRPADAGWHEEDALSTTTDLVAELVRAANEVQKLKTFERHSLFARAVKCVRDIADAFDGPSALAAADEIVTLQVRLAELGAQLDTPEEIRDALLLAATIVRELHIALRSGEDS
jgi:peptidoglycan hydrolase-like protein with peptidoglycan-binding domain